MPFLMCTAYLVCLPIRIHFLLLPWKLTKSGPFGDDWEICESTWFRFSGGLTAKSQSFMAKLTIKVHISNFHGNRVGILKFWFHHYKLWPEEIDLARFCWDRLRNGGGDGCRTWIGAFFGKIWLEIKDFRFPWQPFVHFPTRVFFLSPMAHDLPSHENPVKIGPKMKKK